MRAKLTMALAAAAAGVICLAPIAQAEETAPDRPTTGDSTLSLNVAPTIGDVTTIVGVSIGIPTHVIPPGQPGEEQTGALPIPGVSIMVKGGSSTNVTNIVRLCITCRR